MKRDQDRSSFNIMMYLAEDIGHNDKGAKSSLAPESDERESFDEELEFLL